MEQYISKSALLAEIEKVIDEPAPSHDQQCQWEDGYYSGLYKAESIIDNLEIKEIDSLQETSDLETAADKYAIKMYNMFIEDETILNNKEGDEILSDAFKAGAKWKEQQMMAKAIKGTARPDDNEIWCNLASSNLKDGDKVKVLVVKEN